MKMSDKKRQEVYAAISNSIMDLRISLNKEGEKIDPLSIDGELFKLEARIWLRVKSALNVSGV